MKKLFIVANWKANKNQNDARLWIESFGEEIFSNDSLLANKEVIVCPAFPMLSLVSGYILANNLKISLGSQDVSRFDEGAFTGEVPASILQGIVEYSIIGHSERRANFSETDEILSEKTKLALNSGIVPVFCVQGVDTPVPTGVTIVAYEPIEAIGTGNPDTPENANNVALKLKEKYSFIEHVLYGGSVTSNNVGSFVSMEEISGVLVGGASLDAGEFSSLVKNAR